LKKRSAIANFSTGNQLATVVEPSFQLLVQPRIVNRQRDTVIVQRIHQPINE
jgi:hypothetical protein